MSPSSGFFAGSSLAKDAPARSVPQCGACKRHTHCETPKMGVFGSGERGVLFVGEMPTYDDDSYGEPFSSKNGKRLARVLRRVGFDLDNDGWKTNALICRKAKDHKPTSVEVGYCRPNITKTIKKLKPHVIIPMGAAAVNAVIGGVWKESPGAMARWAGWDIPCQDLNAWVCPTWDAHYLAEEEDSVLDRQQAAHLRRAIAHTEVPWPEGVPKWANNVRIELDATKAAKWLRKCATMDRGAIAWDYETNCLKPDGGEAEIVSCAVAWGETKPERCIAFPWRGEAITAMQELLKSPMPKIASNLKFEDRWTRAKLGHRVRAWVWDTMLAAHVCDNRQGITSVKFQAFVRLGVPVWNDKVDRFLKTKKDTKVNAILKEIAIDDLLLYNGLDAELEFRVAMDQIKELGCPIPWVTSEHF